MKISTSSNVEEIGELRFVLEAVRHARAEAIRVERKRCAAIAESRIVNEAYPEPGRHLTWEEIAARIREGK